MLSVVYFSRIYHHQVWKKVKRHSLRFRDFFGKSWNKSIIEFHFERLPHCHSKIRNALGAVLFLSGCPTEMLYAHFFRAQVDQQAPYSGGSQACIMHPAAHFSSHVQSASHKGLMAWGPCPRMRVCPRMRFDWILCSFSNALLSEKKEQLKAPLIFLR